MPAAGCRWANLLGITDDLLLHGQVEGLTDRHDFATGGGREAADGLFKRRNGEKNRRMGSGTISPPALALAPLGDAQSNQGSGVHCTMQLYPRMAGQSIGPGQVGERQGTNPPQAGRPRQWRGGGRTSRLRLRNVNRFPGPARGFALTIASPAMQATISEQALA